jgi:hypothetical protein
MEMAQLQKKAGIWEFATAAGITHQQWRLAAAPVRGLLLSCLRCNASQK